MYVYVGAGVLQISYLFGGATPAPATHGMAVPYSEQARAKQKGRRVSRSEHKRPPSGSQSVPPKRVTVRPPAVPGRNGSHSPHTLDSDDESAAAGAGVGGRSGVHHEHSPYGASAMRKLDMDNASDV